MLKGELLAQRQVGKVRTGLPPSLGSTWNLQRFSCPSALMSLNVFTP